MTRKVFEKKMKTLIVAIHKHPESVIPHGTKLGEQLKHYNAKGINLQEIGGSYKAAWNTDIIKWCRRYYLGENV